MLYSIICTCIGTIRHVHSLIYSFLRSQLSDPVSSMYWSGVDVDKLRDKQVVLDTFVVIYLNTSMEEVFTDEALV